MAHTVTIGKTTVEFSGPPQIGKRHIFTPAARTLHKAASLLTAVRGRLERDPGCNDCRGISINMGSYSDSAAHLVMEHLAKSTSYRGSLLSLGVEGTAGEHGYSFWVRPEPKYIAQWLWDQVWIQLDSWLTDEDGEGVTVPIGGIETSVVRQVIRRLHCVGGWQASIVGPRPDAGERFYREKPYLRRLVIKIDDRKGSGNEGSGQQAQVLPITRNTQRRPRGRNHREQAAA